MRDEILAALAAVKHDKMTAEVAVHVAVAAVEAFAANPQHAHMSGEDKKRLVPAVVDLVLQNALETGEITLSERVELGRQISEDTDKGIVDRLIELIIAASKQPELVQIATEIAEEVKGLCASKCKPGAKRQRKQ